VFQSVRIEVHAEYELALGDVIFFRRQPLGILARTSLANQFESLTDGVVLVLHGGVNRALLSWFLTGEAVFLGGLAQDPGCVNVIDVGPSARESIVRVVNYSALDPLQTSSRLSTMEHLLGQYMKLRERRTVRPA
jgi:hypothetical protein